jgi:hypothetical protein
MKTKSKLSMTIDDDTLKMLDKYRRSLSRSAMANLILTDVLNDFYEKGVRDAPQAMTVEN